MYNIIQTEIITLNAMKFITLNSLTTVKSSGVFNRKSKVSAQTINYLKKALKYQLRISCYLPIKRNA